MAKRTSIARGKRLRSRDVSSSLAPNSPAAQTAEAKAEAAKASGVKVEATAKGFYGGSRKRPGDRFNLEDATHFSDKWMKRVDGTAPEEPSKPASRGSSTGSGSGSSTGGAGVL